MLAAHPLANTEESDLVEALGLRIRQPEDLQVREVAGEQRDRRLQPFLRHDHQQHTAFHEPPKSMLEKQVLHALVAHGANLGIVG